MVGPEVKSVYKKKKVEGSMDNTKALALSENSSTYSSKKAGIKSGTTGTPATKEEAKGIYKDMQQSTYDKRFRGQETTDRYRANRESDKRMEEARKKRDKAKEKIKSLTGGNKLKIPSKQERGY